MPIKRNKKNYWHYSVLGKKDGAAACGCTVFVGSERLFGATPQCACRGDDNQKHITYAGKEYS